MNRAYVSATGNHSVTISGPPSTLEKLADSVPSFGSLRQAQLPIHGPYHAQHLYSERSVRAILQPFDDILRLYRPRLPLTSSSTGKLVSASDAFRLVEVAVEDILKKPLHWNLIVESVCSEVESLGVAECTILPLGSIESGRSLVSLLKKRKSDCVVSLNDSLWTSSHPKASILPSGKFADSKIAIVGMAGRFPNAANHELFWQLLEKGTDTHKIIPKDRFDEAHIDPTGHRKNTSHTPYGCFIDEPGLFDPRFFRMSPREATQTDPMHRLAILTAYEALEMSGYVPNRTTSTRLHRIGTFYGQTSDDWREIQEGQNIDTYFIPGGVRAFAPGRINYYFKFSGPSFSVDTACSSSFAALQLAITSLRAGDCDTAVTGGVNVLTNPDIFSGLSRGQFLSKSGNCQTFDNEADGYCRGEGVASVILKRLEDAEADKDNILAVILSSATNHSADAISITHPHAPTQQYLYKQLLNSAGIDANDICYVEMHGTGTQAGDGAEMESVTNVFANPKCKRRSNQPLHLGAVKANIGHGEAVSGVCALIKVLLMMEKNVIPPNCGIKRVINQGFPKDLEARNVHIPLRPTSWPRPKHGIRRVYVSNFSAAGGNTGVIMEDAPSVLAPDTQDPRSFHVVTVSGKSKSSLRNNVQQLIDFIDEDTSATLPNLSYTTTARRIHHNYRVAVTEPGLTAVKKSLTSMLDKDVAPIAPTRPDVAFVFTGQGAHYSALGKQLFDQSTQFRSDIFQFDEMAQAENLPSFLPLIDGSLADISGLSSVIVQVGCVCVQMALARLWIAWGVGPSVVVGHSLGEYAALNAAGVLSASDTIYLVGKRAQELENTCTPGTHAMLAVAESVNSLDLFMADYAVEIACINSSNDTVLGGPNDEIDKLAEELDRKGVNSTKLQIPFAFHVSQVDPILETFEKAATGVTFNVPSIPVLSPLLGDVIRQEGSFGPTYVKRHARETVDFPKGIDAGFRDGVVSEKMIWIEVGPHPVCLSMVKKTLGPTVTAVPSLRRNEDCWKVISSSLASLYRSGLDIDWSEYHKEFNSAHQLLRLPTYCFDFKNYWINYVGNWCLTKGDIETTTQISKPTQKLSTISVQNILEENLQGIEANVTIESDLSEPKLKAVLQGHRVNSNALCPSSLNADMALTIADYLYRQLKPGSKTPALNCSRMEVNKPLILNGGSEAQLLRAYGSANLEAGEVKVNFYSVTSEGKKKTDHAKCVVSFTSSEAIFSNWQRNRYLIKPRIEALVNGANTGKGDKMRRSLAYSLFGNFVEYGASYRGLEEVDLDFDEYEATAKVAFQTKDEESNFFCSPYWIDSVGHLSGFILNVKEALGDKTQVFISHGWESMCFAHALSRNVTYRSYVKMQPAGGKMMAGDVILFEEDEIIGVIEGIRFQSIPRTLLNKFLPPPGGSMQKTDPQVTITNGQPTRKVDKLKPTVAPTLVTTPSVHEVQTTVSSRALTVVAEEVGVSTSELSGNVVFEEMGVDSLMVLTISARLREELDMEISPTWFVDCPTVAQFLKYLKTPDSAVVAFEVPETSTGSSSPDTLQSGDESSDDDAAADGSPITPVSLARDDDMVTNIRATIADEMGMPIDEVVGDTDLGSMGMDSLMTLTILAQLRETTGQDLSPDFFVDNPSITAIEDALCPKSKPTVMVPSIERLAREKPRTVPIESLPSATSLLLQGNPKAAKTTLFLFPDGSGAAAAYAAISPIGPDVAVYGLNCPYMKTPDQFLFGIPEVSALYKAEVRRRQPTGPYYLGGWSAGGVIAYEVALQLTREGEAINRLILFDAPCPVRLEALPPRLHVFFDEVGLLGTGTGTAPSWLLPHFRSAIRALDEYRPVPMDPATGPEKVLAIWASDGVCGDPDGPKLAYEEGDPENMRWLLENRTDFGSNGWEALLGKGKMQFATMKCNHFTMMRQPMVSSPPCFS